MISFHLAGICVRPVCVFVRLNRQYCIAYEKTVVDASFVTGVESASNHRFVVNKSIENELLEETLHMPALLYLPPYPFVEMIGPQVRESIKRVEFKVFENERDNWTFCYIFATIPAPEGISVVSRNVVVYKAQQKVNTSKQNKQSNAV